MAGPTQSMPDVALHRLVKLRRCPRQHHAVPGNITVCQFQRLRDVWIVSKTSTSQLVGCAVARVLLSILSLIRRRSNECTACAVGYTRHARTLEPARIPSFECVRICSGALSAGSNSRRRKKNNATAKPTQMQSRVIELRSDGACMVLLSLCPNDRRCVHRVLEAIHTQEEKEKCHIEANATAEQSDGIGK